MKLLTILTLLIPQVLWADGLVLTDGKFPEKQYGPSVLLTLTQAQQKLLSSPENREKRLIELKLTEEQEQKVFQEAQLKIDSINIFEGKTGYGDCTCHGVASNLAARISSTQAQVPHVFIGDALMQKASEEALNRMLNWKPGELNSRNKNYKAYQLSGQVSNLPVEFTLTIPNDQKALIKGEYTYLSGKYKGQTFKLLGTQTAKNVFQLREYDSSKRSLRHTADIQLTLTNKLLTSRDPWRGQMTNIDGKTFNINLFTDKKIKPESALMAMGH